MKATNRKFLADKFSKYQNGQLNETERKAIDNWFETRMAEQPVLIEPKSDAEELRRELFTRIIRSIPEHSTKKRWYRSIWFEIAAVLFVIAGLSLLKFQNFAPLKSDLQPAMKTFRTAKGEIRKIVLPDGTSIWMNAGTLIKIPQDFSSAKQRAIRMEYGEAFFQVKRDTLRPFSITTRQFVTTVLGTSFNIRSYPGLHNYQVSVRTGKVKVMQIKGSKQEILSAGLVRDQYLSYNDQTRQSAISTQDNALYCNWRNDRSMYFENMDLRQIGAELSRQYNIDVTVTEAKHLLPTYTIKLQHRDIRQVLLQIVLKTGMNYKLTKDKLTINPGT
jgi:transmembrane sensor